ncbi:hemerythrin domain-containing protein [Acidiferrimicrobium sp. IK]|uniref:hemerythrin domain-containing protein n=1 Tax=Acidiferrimicrobium sp. IK TaxID=2871700 RepID=UPI0021CB2E47|nr:hemerythrin domain-containing protein [Acidiferrimicrobium sp. IK]MCU4185248.1 hemerythrin domain-containing protein [Acidiferrimicrobium sp. IK]
MPDICDLILDDHETLRRRFAEMDQSRSDPAALARVWSKLGPFLDLHAAAEEEVFYPTLVRHGDDGEDETLDAIHDHNKIRDAVAAAAGAEIASGAWWAAVEEARNQNSDHMAEEERGALADLRSGTERTRRDELGAAFLAFKSEHPDGSHLHVEDKDPAGYVDQQR